MANLATSTEDLEQELQSTMAKRLANADVPGSEVILKHILDRAINRFRQVAAQMRSEIIETTTIAKAPPCLDTAVKLHAKQMVTDLIEHTRKLVETGVQPATPPPPPPARARSPAKPNKSKAEVPASPGPAAKSSKSKIRTRSTVKPKRK